MSSPVYVLGGSQTDFAQRAGDGPEALYDLLAKASSEALDDAGVAAEDIEVGHVGNLAGELFCGQAQLGGMLASLDPAFAMLPTSRHEAACASGSIAVLAAMADLESGRYDVALVIGAEVMRNVSSKQAAEHLGSAAWVGREAQHAAWPWPAMFSTIADEYADRYGLPTEHLTRIAEVNLTNARRNPLAQTREWDLPSGSFGPDDELNPVVEGRLRKQDCGRITDGAAAVVLASPAYAERHAARRGLDLAALPVIQGWGHRTAPLLLETKLTGSREEPYVFPHLRLAGQEALKRAGLNEVWELDAIETHDCFTITEYVALDHLGLTAPGQSWQAVEDGTIDAGGRLPVNPSGGLIGLGHPVGATGVRMLRDAARQVTGTAGECQVEDARRVATLNIGGSCTTVVSLVVGRGPA